MNLLFFVMATLFLMTAITMSRLDSFVKLQWQSIEWKKRIIEAERSTFNNSFLRCDLKDRSQDNSQNKSQEKPQAPPKTPKNNPQPGTSKGTGKLSQKWLLDPSFRKNHETALPKILDFFKSLIQLLYKNQPFYKKMEARRPQFIEELYAEIFRLSDSFKVDNPKKSLSPETLLKMRWQDNDLRTFFARLVQENLLYENATPQEKRENLSDDFAINLSETQEKAPFSKAGYISIQDFLTSGSQEKIRLWLADRPILFVFFKDPAIVDAIEKSRREIYPEVRKKGVPPETFEAAKKRLEEEFPPSKSPYGDLLDYTVTKTAPN